MEQEEKGVGQSLKNEGASTDKRKKMQVLRIWKQKCLLPLTCASGDNSVWEAGKEESWPFEKAAAEMALGVHACICMQNPDAQLINESSYINSSMVTVFILMSEPVIKNNL